MQPSGSFTGRRLSRRGAVRAGGLGVAAALSAGTLGATRAQDATPAAAEPTGGGLPQDGLSVEILEAFSSLPGTKALKMWAPPDAGRPAWSVTLDSDRELVIASAFKGFVLTEYLRQAEESLDPASETPIAAQLNAKLAEELVLDESVFALGSSILNPPNLTGKISARTALQAMEIASDNTATDMVLKHIGPERVRELIASLGLTQTRIPDSTRQYVGYLYGDPDWRTITWEQVVALVTDAPYPPGAPLNDECTMASSADDLVSLYSRALPGTLFRYPETLSVFRGILSLADTINRVMPLGLNAFLKAGSIDAFTNHVLAMAGGVYAAERWVYFAMILNWTDDEAGTVASVGPAFSSVTNTMFTLVRDRLGA